MREGNKSALLDKPLYNLQSSISLVPKTYVALALLLIFTSLLGLCFCNRKGVIFASSNVFQIISHLDDDAVLGNAEHGGKLLQEAAGPLHPTVDGDLLLLLDDLGGKAPRPSP